MFSFTYQRNLTLTVAGAVFCLTPLLFLSFEEQYTTDDSTGNILAQYLTERSIAMMAPFFVIIIPTFDLLLDLPSHISSYLHPNEKLAVVENSNISCLTDTERALFMFGVAAQSSVVFLSSDVSHERLVIVYSCTDCFSLHLCLSVVVCFLGRVTTTFTDFRAFVIIGTTVLGMMFQTIRNFVRFDAASYLLLSNAGFLILGVSFILHVLTISICFYKYYRLHLSSPMSRKEHFSWHFSWLFYSQKMNLNNIIKYDDYMYSNYIPALHMMSTLIITSANNIPLINANDIMLSLDLRHYITLAAEVFILIIELRIRKIEITRGLIDLLDSKRLYVRHISHELRTPLNTAFLGLKLLTSELKSSDYPKDADRYDTLCDVNLSYMAAVDILNDLLCYEKLESGILELHKENINVIPFLKDCAAMFSVQARECGVTMSILPDIHGMTLENKGETAIPIRAHDSLYVDKFKMDQVIRNLISNALKFTPGAITIKAVFVQDHGGGTGGLKGSGRIGGSGGLKRVESDDKRGVSEKGVMSCWKIVKKVVPRRDSEERRVACDTKEERVVCGDSEIVHGKLVVVVTDTGAGISPENQKRLFNGIVQFSPEKLQAGGGSGLGLWITGGIVDLHGGKISVHSAGEGMGSSFTLELPMSRGPIAPPSPRSIHRKADSWVRESPILSRRLLIDSQSYNRGVSEIIPPGVPTGIPLGIAMGPLGGVGGGLSSLPPPVSPLGSSLIGPILASSSVMVLPLVVPPSIEPLVAVSVTNSTINSTINSVRNSITNSVKYVAPCYNLLVVDDSRLNRKMLMKCLVNDGHTCTEATDGLEAVAKVKEKMACKNGQKSYYDAVLMDFIMPNMDGPSATKEIRAMGYSHPIFGVTGNGLPSDIAHFLHCGADQVLLKPLDIESFAAAMSDRLNLTERID